MDITVEEVERLKQLYNNKVKGSELIRCKVALCLNQKNMYRLIYQNYFGAEKKVRKKTQIEGIFGVTYNTMYLTSAQNKGIHFSTLQDIIRGITNFRKKVENLDDQTILKQLEPIGLSDFVDEDTSEDSLLRFAKKLGICEPYIKAVPEDRTADRDLENYFSRATRLAVILALDEEKNTLKKPGCGVYLEAGKAAKLIQQYEGVYALYFPTGLSLNSHKTCYSRATMRVSHVMATDDVWVVRVKLNMPNHAINTARFQYRGYLTPVANDDHLNITLYLATTSINREHFLPNEPVLQPDTVTILSTKMANSKSVFRGILSSISQREEGSPRMPYASKVLIQKQQFEGDEEEVYQNEKSFMMGGGLGMYEGLDAMLTSIDKKPEFQNVKGYFQDQCNTPAMIVSEAWPQTVIS